MPAKIPITQYILDRTKELFDLGWGAVKIARDLGISKDIVKKNIYKLLGINTAGRKLPRTTYLRTEYICKTCHILKPIDQFRKRYNKKTDRTGYETECIICEAIRHDDNFKKC